MAKLSDTPTPADTEAVDEGWEEVAAGADAKPTDEAKADAEAEASNAAATADHATPTEAVKADKANAEKKISNKTTPPVRPTMPTVEEDDPLVYDVDEGRPTLPMVDPLAFDKAEPDD